MIRHKYTNLRMKNRLIFIECAIHPGLIVMSWEGDCDEITVVFIVTAYATHTASDAFLGEAHHLAVSWPEI